MFNLIIFVINGKLWLLSPSAKKNCDNNDRKQDGKNSSVKVTSREGKKQREPIHCPSSSHYNQAVLRSMKENPHKTLKCVIPVACI